MKQKRRENVCHMKSWKFGEQARNFHTHLCVVSSITVLVLTVTGFYHPPNHTGSCKDYQTPSQASVHFKTLFICKPFFKSNLQNQSIHHIKHK